MQKSASLILIAVGILLLIYMILVESEPGAIPLFMIASGTAWYFITKNRNPTEQ